MVFTLLLLSLLSSGASPITIDEGSESRGNSSPADTYKLETELRVRVLRGNANYVLPQGGSVKRLRPADEALRADSGIYLEFGISTKVELVWTGVGSIRLEGPASLSWKTGLMDLRSKDSKLSLFLDSKKKSGTQRPSDKTETILSRFEAHKRNLITNRPPISQPVSVVFGAFRIVELEAHGPGFQLLFDREGWKLEVSSGALRLVSRKDEQLEVNHHGGLPVRVRTNQLRPPGTWPVRIRSGSRVRLPAPLRE